MLSSYPNCHSSPDPLRCIMSQKSRCELLFWALFPHFCLITCLVLYSFAGARLFQWLEGSSGDDQSEADVLLEKLWNVSWAVNRNASASEPPLYIYICIFCTHTELYVLTSLAACLFWESIEARNSQGTGIFTNGAPRVSVCGKNPTHETSILLVTANRCQIYWPDQYSS